MNNLLKFKYSLKIKNKSLTFSIILYYITCIFLILFADLWELVKLTSVLIPIALCTNVLSEEYDNKREGMIIPNGTPLYKIVFERYFISFFISELLILSLFFIARISNHLEGDPFLNHFIIVFIYSLFLTLLGLLISNITKNTISGYAVSIGYFIFQLIAGNFLFGRYIPLLASSFNLSLKEHIIMNNIYFMIVISIILFLINLLYISSEEKIKKRTLKIAALGIAIFFIALCVNKYINYNKSILASKILNSNKETVYIIDKGNQDLSSYCKSKNINFLEQNSISLKKYKNKNIVVISKYGSKLTNNINNILKLNIELDERDLMIKNNGIYDVNSFRILVNNPLNKENKILVIQSRSINSKDLNTLLNEKHGDFATVKNGSVVANAVYNPQDINANNCFEKINTLNNRGWLIKKINGAEMLYRNLEKKDVQHLFSLWGKIKNVIDKNITGTHSNKQFQVYFRNDDVNLEQNFIPLKIDLLIDLEKRREYKIRDAFCKKYLDAKGFKFISDERLKDGWEEFILQTKVLYDDSTYENEYIRGIKEKLKKENQFSKEYDYSYFAQKMLCLINNKDKRMNFINKIISNNSQISNSEIEKIYSKYVGAEEAKKAMKYFNKK